MTQTYPCKNLSLGLMSILGFGMYSRSGKWSSSEGQRPQSNDEGFTFAEVDGLGPIWWGEAVKL